jgi:tetratricopeptide (TPR) repeat protein
MQPGTSFNPFPGLRAFEPDEDHLFFGREKEIDDLLRRLRTTRFLTVIGSSGSGKSSLVRSGLIPALESGLMARAGSNWRIATLRPGADPIGNLAAALDAPDVLPASGDLASTNRVLLEATLHRGTLGIVNAVRQAKIPPQDNLLLVVDQFEELFRFRRNQQIQNSRDEAAAFVKLLLEAAQQDDIPVYVILTMRSDFIGDCIEFAGLPEAVNKGQYLVPRMTRDELRSAITGPVAVSGGEITPRLVLRLLNDLGDDQDQLPILQHALMRTWNHWQEHGEAAQPIDVADYEAIGTLREALSLHAEEAYRETEAEGQRRLAEEVFKALTDTFSDPRGLRRPTSVRELAAICEVSEADIIRLVEVFRRTGRCFLMPSKGALDAASIVDLSHESLMRCWTRLITWAEEERASAEVYARLSQAAGWFEQGTAGLWRNPELEIGLKWRRKNAPTEAWAARYDPFFARAMRFLDRSEEERKGVEAERERQRRRTLKLAWSVASFLGFLFVIATVLAILASKENKRAEANLHMAETAVDESLSSAGRQQAREGADVPQLEQFRRELLDEAMPFYAQFTKESPRNEDLRQEAAWAHSRIADINRLLGNRPKAVDEYHLAITQFQTLAGNHPRDPGHRQALAYAYNWLGETLRQWLEDSPTSEKYTFADAQGAYDSALKLQRVLHDENPQNGDYQQELARTYYNRGILDYDMGRPNDSESDFRKAIALLEPLSHKVQSEPEGTRSNPDPSQELARVYNNLGVLLSNEKHPQTAKDFYTRAISLQEALTKKDPDNRQYKFELVTYYDNLAGLEVDTNQLDAARRNNHEAVDLIEDLVSPSPSLGLQRAHDSRLHPGISRFTGSGGGNAAHVRDSPAHAEFRRGSGPFRIPRHVHESGR